MSRYYKGYEKNTNRYMIVEFYDEPKKKLFGLHCPNDEMEMGQYSFMDHCGLNSISESTLDKFNNDFHLARQISKREYEIFQLLQSISTEIYMHDITGGFPSREGTPRMCRQLEREVRLYCKNDIETETESFANAISDMIKKQEEERGEIIV